MRRTFARLLAVSIGAFALSCSGPGADPGPTLAGPFPSFPYVFSGNFTVAGQPGPEGVLVFARMGGTHSDPAASPRDGFYNNVVIGPSHERSADLTEPIRFYIGSLDGPSVEADQTFTFKVVGNITNTELNLSFPRLP